MQQDMDDQELHRPSCASWGRKSKRGIAKPNDFTEGIDVPKFFAGNRWRRALPSGKAMEKAFACGLGELGDNPSISLK
jgi:hypothetical protein